MPQPKSLFPSKSEQLLPTIDPSLLNPQTYQIPNQIFRTNQGTHQQYKMLHKIAPNLSSQVSLYAANKHQNLENKQNLFDEKAMMEGDQQ